LRKMNYYNRTFVLAFLVFVSYSTSLVAAQNSVELFGSKNVYIFFKPVSNTSSTSGYTITDINKGLVTQVTRIQFTSVTTDLKNAFLDSNYGDAILYGHLIAETNTTYFFKVISQFLVLPTASIVPSLGDQYFTVKVLAILCSIGLIPCDELQATEINTSFETSVTIFDLEIGGVTWLDSNWLSGRIEEGRAIAQGFIATYPYDSTHSGTKLTAERVFVELPDRTIPCAAVNSSYCASPLIPAYSLDSNRCLIEPPSCVSAPHCTSPPIAACISGWSFFSYPALPSGCPAYFCYPSFIDLV